jgi:hypothetical protein
MPRRPIRTGHPVNIFVEELLTRGTQELVIHLVDPLRMAAMDIKRITVTARLAEDRATWRVHQVTLSGPKIKKDGTPGIPWAAQEYSDRHTNNPGMLPLNELPDLVRELLTNYLATSLEQDIP